MENNNTMGQRLILSEQEKRKIQEMYGLINEQPTDNVDYKWPKGPSGELKYKGGQPPNYATQLNDFLPILNKTVEELKNIEQEEMVNQVMNTNMTNSSMIENMSGFWKALTSGYAALGPGEVASEIENKYREPFQMVQNMIKTQKIDGNYLPVKWLRDVLLLSKSEFQDFIKDVKNLEGLLDKHRVDKDKNDLLKINRLGSRVPPDLRYRVRELTNMINSLGSNDDVSTTDRPKPSTVQRPKPRPSTVQRPK